MVLDCCNELVSTGIDISLDINVPYTNCDGSTVDDDAVDSVWKRILVVAKYSSDVYYPVTAPKCSETHYKQVL